MATFTNLEINGVIDTSQSVSSNLNTLCTASGCWMTFDTNTGQWSVIINRPGTSVKSFDNSNIIGSINVSGTGINEYYNSVSVEFPHSDLRDQTDYVDLEIPEEDRYPNELDNKLQMSLDNINNTIQAQYLGTIELKQSRVDKVIEFRTDYTAFGLKAGDLIDITSDVYGYTSKMFRITKIMEDDPNDGSIQLSITALEYDPAVYDSSGLERTERNKKTGIVPKAQNTALTKSDNDNTTKSLMDSIKDPALLALLLKALTPSGGGSGMTPQIYTFMTSIINATEPDGGLHEISLGKSVVAPYTGTYKVTYSINWGGVGAPGVNGVKKNSVLIIKNAGGTTINDTGLSNTGDENVQLYEDHFLDSLFTATQGQQLNFWFGYATDWGGDYGGNGGAGTSALFLINCEMHYVSQ